MGASLSSPSKETKTTTTTKSTIEKIEINRKLFFGRLPSSSCPINNKKEEEDNNKFEDYAIDIINNNINNSLNIYEPIWSTNSYIYNYCNNNNNSNDDDDVQQ